MRKTLLSLWLAMLIMLMSVTTAWAVSVNWGAANPIYDETGVGGTYLADGDVVQLIWDQAADGIDPPGNDGLPADDDQLMATSSIGSGSFPNTGRFSANINTQVIGTGDRVYIRAWNTNAIPGTVTIGVYYGDSPVAIVNSAVAFTFDATATGSFATVIPLAVTLASFEATCEGEDIVVTWQTESELDTMGFNIWRSESPVGPTTRLNPEMIPAHHPGSPFGSSYEFRDSEITMGIAYYYWLEDLEFGGGTNYHGPISAACNQPTVLFLGSFEVGAHSFGSVSSIWIGFLIASGMVFAIFHASRRRQ